MKRPLLVLLALMLSVIEVRAITVDDSTVARFSGSIAQSASIVSGTFTPPDNSLLIVTITAPRVTVPTVAGGSLTYTERAVGTTGTGRSAIWTAPVTTGASMTVTITNNDPTSGFFSSKVYILTGADNTSPAGANTGGEEPTTNNITINITATAAGRLFGTAMDDGGRGLPSSTDIEDALDSSADVMSAYKSADHIAGAGSIGINFDAGGTGTGVWLYAVLEIKAEAAPPSEGCNIAMNAASSAFLLNDGVSYIRRNVETGCPAGGVVNQNLPLMGVGS